MRDGRTAGFDPEDPSHVYVGDMLQIENMTEKHKSALFYLISKYIHEELTPYTGAMDLENSMHNPLISVLDQFISVDTYNNKIGFFEKNKFLKLIKKQELLQI